MSIHGWPRKLTDEEWRRGRVSGAIYWEVWTRGEYNEPELVTRGGPRSIALELLFDGHLDKASQAGYDIYIYEPVAAQRDGETK